jgi:hypothetical protein
MQVLLSGADSTYRNQLSSAVLKLQESGKLAKMKNRWWKEERGGGKCAVSYSYASNAMKMISLDCMYYIV